MIATIKDLKKKVFKTIIIANENNQLCITTNKNENTYIIVLAKKTTYYIYIYSKILNINLPLVNYRLATPNVSFFTWKPYMANHNSG